MVTDGMYQTMFVVPTNSVMPIEAAPPIEHNMLKAIKSVTSKQEEPYRFPPQTITRGPVSIACPSYNNFW
jgi:hypothetical protein